MNLEPKKPFRGFGNKSLASSNTSTTPPKTNQTEASLEDRTIRFTSRPEDNRYEQLKADREALKQSYIKQGKITDKTQHLVNAISFTGECLDMCPEFERYERELQMGLDPFEKLENSDLVDHSKAVKRFRRSAAGDEEPLPCDVRSPQVLTKTLNYLISVLNDHGLEKSYSFVRDRARSIRKDFFLQNYRGLEAVECHEKIARYHIICSHELCETSAVSLQQEHEQMRKTLQSLREYYSDLEKENIFCPNEPEFQAYYLLSHLFQSEFVSKAESLRQEVFKSKQVQLAIEFHHIVQRNNEFSRSHHLSEGSVNAYARFFRLLADPSVSYLFACLLHVKFPIQLNIDPCKKSDIQILLFKAYYCFPDQEAYTFNGHDLVGLLGMNDLIHLKECLDYYEIPYSENGPSCIIYMGKMKIDGKIKNGNFKEDQRVSFPPKCSRIIRSKKERVSFVDIINGGELSFNPALGSFNNIRQAQQISFQTTQNILQPANQMSFQMSQNPTVPPSTIVFQSSQNSIQPSNIHFQTTQNVQPSIIVFQTSQKPAQPSSQISFQTSQNSNIQPSNIVFQTSQKTIQPTSQILFQTCQNSFVPPSNIHFQTSQKPAQPSNQISFQTTQNSFFPPSNIHFQTSLHPSNIHFQIPQQSQNIPTQMSSLGIPVVSNKAEISDKECLDIICSLTEPIIISIVQQVHSEYMQEQHRIKIQRYHQQLEYQRQIEEKERFITDICCNVSLNICLEIIQSYILKSVYSEICESLIEESAYKVVTEFSLESKALVVYQGHLMKRVFNKLRYRFSIREYKKQERRKFVDSFRENTYSFGVGPSLFIGKAQSTVYRTDIFGRMVFVEDDENKKSSNVSNGIQLSSKGMDEFDYEINRKMNLSSRPINIPLLITPLLFSKQKKKSLFWKLAVNYSNNQQDLAISTFMMDWIKLKLNIDKSDKFINQSSQFHQGHTVSCTVCVESIDTISIKKISSPSASIYIFSIFTPNMTESEFWNHERNRFIAFLERLDRIEIPLLLVIMTHSYFNINEFTKRVPIEFDLENLLNQGYFNCIQVLDFPISNQDSMFSFDRIACETAFQEKIEWLASMTNPTPTIDNNFDKITTVCMDHIKFLYKKISNIETQYSNPVHHFNTGIQLYNYFIDNLEYLSCNSTLSRVSFPPFEFEPIISIPMNWNQVSNFQKRKERIQLFKLGFIEGSVINNEVLLNYIMKLSNIPGSSETLIRNLYSKIKYSFQEADQGLYSMLYSLLQTMVMLLTVEQSQTHYYYIKEQVEESVSLFKTRTNECIQVVEKEYFNSQQNKLKRQTQVDLKERKVIKMDNVGRDELVKSIETSRRIVDELFKLYEMADQNINK